MNKSRLLKLSGVTFLVLILVQAAAAQAFQKNSYSIPMRDGAKLATDVYVPEDYSKDAYPHGLPIILVRTIYSKDKGSEAAFRWRDVFVRNGYAFVIQDVRGFFASAGAKGRSKAYDGYDTIEWLAAQPWSSGKVGMLGLSALGAAQYEAAVTAPPHLACAIPAQAPGNYYTDAFYPPRFRKADMETILRGTFTATTRQLIEKRIRTYQDSRIDQFNIPMLHSSGWYDFYKEGAIEMFQAVQERGGPGALGTQKLLIGPWGHGVIQEENLGEPLELPGGMTYPANAKLDWENEVWLPWFDSCLKGEPTGVMETPAVKYYLMGDVDNPNAPGNEWVEADSFPPPSTQTPYFITGDHKLSPTAPAREEARISYVYDPANPVPTVGRKDARIPVKGPLDQREVEGRDDVLLFSTEELAEALQIVGQIRVRLWASSDRADTDFTVKLTDVYPDGRSMIFADGIVKGRYRNTFLKEELLEPGQVYEFDLDLGYIAIALAPGHRLRLAISSSNYDRFDINPNTGEPYGLHATSQQLSAELFGKQINENRTLEFTETQVATNTIYMDPIHPSQVILPLVAE